MRLLKIFFLILLLSPWFILKAEAQINDVWAVGDGEKIFKYNTDHFA